MLPSRPWRPWLAAALMLANALVHAQAPFKFADTKTVLPKNIVPRHATLALDLDPALDFFEGQVRYALRLTSSAPAIMLHAAAELELQRMEFRGPRGQVLLQRVPSDVRETWRLVRADGRSLAPGDYRLAIVYRGRVSVPARGLYAVGYTIDGAPARMLATQLEATEARRLLPAFDEPVVRMPYTVSVRAPVGYQVLSNMPSTSVSADSAAGSQVRHSFAPTPPMQSYLLAITVGRFDVLTGEVDGIPLRIFTAPGKREQAQAAMAATKQFVAYYQRYFGRRLAVPKLDQVAVPGVRVGAMEDWGLISYAENLLLFDPAGTSPGQWIRSYNVIAHEISHQWFGNLVSPASWSEIWLNEAFATWMQRKVVDYFHPEWQTALRSRGSLEATMDEDAAGTSRPIRGGDVSEEQVNDIFDTITYEKGGSVLAMVEQWVGAESFQRGLQSYMAARSLKPATAGDLWHHFGLATGMPVGRVASSWTDQRGVPVLDVDARCESDATVISLRQSRLAALDALPGQLWAIPVTLARGDDKRTLLLDGTEASIRMPGCSDVPLLANAGAAGYYRVRYAPALQQRLVDGFTTLAPADQMATLGDSMALARAGHKPMAEHLALLAQLPKVQGAQRSALYLRALAQWRELDLVFDGLPLQTSLRAKARALLGPEFQRLTWSAAAAESVDDSELRGQLIVQLARFGDQTVLEGARQRFGAALSRDTQAVAPALRAPMLFSAALSGGAAEFDALLDALRRASSQQERLLLLGALPAVPGAEFTQRLLDEALSGRLPSDISARIPSFVALLPAGGPAAYAFVIGHWDQLAALAGQGAFLGRQWLLPRAAGWAVDEAWAQRLLDDNRRLLAAVGSANAEREAAVIRVRARLRQREGQRLLPVLPPVPMPLPVPLNVR